MRIDKLLWYLRFAKTRSLAHSMAEAGHMRLNGRRVERAHQRVAAGDVIVVAMGDAGVRVIELLVLPVRRGPAIEAQACYRLLDAPGHSLLAAAPNTAAAQEDPQL